MIYSIQEAINMFPNIPPEVVAGLEELGYVVGSVLSEAANVFLANNS